MDELGLTENCNNSFPDFLVAPGLSLADLQQQALINRRGKGTDQAEEFSRRIRVGLPGF